MVKKRQKSRCIDCEINEHIKVIRHSSLSQLKTRLSRKQRAFLITSLHPEINCQLHLANVLSLNSD